ncbi:MAG: hypothetical protein M3Z37_04960, partial [Candidatus Eremiobacteraeota bacterium]|nr:hypothetical protein [Candidatus Eremiobacteraeota bacterium]
MIQLDQVVKRNADTSYEVRDDRVLVGASLGNSSVWLVGKATGAIQKIFSLPIGQDVFWSTVVTYGSPHHHVLVGFDPEERAAEERAGRGGHVILAPVAPGNFTY